MSHKVLNEKHNLSFDVMATAGASDLHRAARSLRVKHKTWMSII